MNMKEHDNTICESCSCLLRNLGKVRHCLTQEASLSLVHAFISSQIDHMNALLYGSPKIWWTSCNGYKTLQHELSPNASTETTSPQFWLDCIGYQLKREWNKRYRWQPESHNMVWSHSKSMTSSDHIGLLAHSAHWICIWSINPDPGLCSMEINPSHCVFLTSGTRCPSTSASTTWTWIIRDWVKNISL